MNLSKVGVLLYGTLSYIFFLATFVYCIGFVMGIGVPKHLDTVAAGDVPTLTKALLINGGILGLFAVQHLIMARHWFKRWFTKYIPAAAERSTYVLVTCLILCAMYFVWQPMPTVVWEVTSPVLRGVLNSISLAGFVGVVAVTFMIDHFELFGLSQVIRNFTGRKYESPSFQVRSLYRIVRHPLYLVFFIAFWAAPTMTVSRLFFAIMCTAFTLVGVRFEERGLIEEHGEAYLQYKRDIPMIIPSIGRIADPIAPMRSSSTTG